MSTDYETATSTATPTTTTGGQNATWRDRLRSDVGAMSYADGAATLGAAPKADAPDPHATATEKLGELEGSDHENRDLCYMENANKIGLILAAYKEKLAEDDKKTTAGGGAAQHTDEIGKVSEIVAFLEYAKTFVDSLSMKGKAKNDARKKMEELAEKAFPDLEADAAGKAAKAMYYLISTQPGQIRRMDVPLRGAGVGAAMVKMGAGELIYHEEMKAGKLKPGAALQMWWGGDYRLNGQEAGETTTLSAKGVYHAISKGRIAGDQGIMGHSVTFVRYDEADTNTIWYMQQWGNDLDSMDLSDSSSYLVGANISTKGGAETSAEHVLMDTGFKADPGLDALKSRGRRYKLDPAKLAAALVAGIAGSDHADKAKLQTSAARYGTPTEFNHDLVRLIGLWQYAVGITVDGDFGNGSCAALTGTKLDKATAIKVSD